MLHFPIPRMLQKLEVFEVFELLFPCWCLGVCEKILRFSTLHVAWFQEDMGRIVPRNPCVFCWCVALNLDSEKFWYALWHSGCGWHVVLLGRCFSLTRFWLPRSVDWGFHESHVLWSNLGDLGCFLTCTPPKTNMSPENQRLEDVFPIILGACYMLVFEGLYCWDFSDCLQSTKQGIDKYCQVVVCLYLLSPIFLC